MTKFVKNEILILKSNLKLASSDYKKGQRFVVTRATATKAHLNLLDENNMLVEDSAITGSTSSIAAFFNTSNQKLIIKTSDAGVKKGDFFTFKMDFKNDDIIFPKGTRVVINKAGANPQFTTLYKQENGNTYGLAVSPAFIKKYLEPTEAAECDLSRDWKVKALKAQDTQDGYSFTFNLYYKGKKAACAGNFGIGGPNYTHSVTAEWTKLIDDAIAFAAPLDQSHDKYYSCCGKMEESLVEFFFANQNGLQSLTDYLTASINEWNKFTKKHSHKAG